MFLNFLKIHKKAPVPDSLFNKFAGLTASNFTGKEAQAHVFSYEFWETFKNIFFIVKSVTRSFIMLNTIIVLIMMKLLVILFIMKLIAETNVLNLFYRTPPVAPSVWRRSTLFLKNCYIGRAMCGHLNTYGLFGNYYFN